jgi:hypothetical protein
VRSSDGQDNEIGKWKCTIVHLDGNATLIGRIPILCEVLNGGYEMQVNMNMLRSDGVEALSTGLGGSVRATSVRIDVAPCLTALVVG